MLFETNEGYFPYSRIVSISNATLKAPGNRSAGTYHTVTLHSPDDQVRIEAHEFARLMEGQARIIPALPGTYAIWLSDDVEETVETAWRLPVIGWAMDAEGGIKPITGDGVEENDSVIIEYPDGRVRVGYQQFAASLAEHLKDKALHSGS